MPGGAKFHGDAGHADQCLERFTVGAVAIGIQGRNAFTSGDERYRDHAVSVTKIQRLQKGTVTAPSVSRRCTGGYGIAEGRVGRRRKMNLSNRILGRLIGTKDLPTDEVIILDNEKRATVGKLLGVLDQRFEYR